MSLILGATMCGGVLSAAACTGISLTAKDGSYVQARTIENANEPLPSDYVIIPRGHQITSFTPVGKNGLTYRAKYGVVGLSVVREEFIAEGVNEAGLSAGLFFFPTYGSYMPYDANDAAHTLGDLQVPTWILANFATIDELKSGLKGVRIVGLDKTAVVHWRIGEKSGRQVVLEIVNGVPHFYENQVGVLTNAPGFKWHITNLNNYVNLRAGSAPKEQLSGITLSPLGESSAMLGLPGDATSPSRFVRAAFLKATAPVQPTAMDAILQAFHLLNNFDVPIGIEHSAGNVPDMPSATQWTSAIDLTNGRVYYKTMYNNTIRCIDLAGIDFGKVAYQVHPLDRQKQQPIEHIIVR